MHIHQIKILQNRLCSNKVCSRKHLQGGLIMNAKFSRNNSPAIEYIVELNVSEIYFSAIKFPEANSHNPF